MTTPIDELLERLRKSEAECRDLAARLEKYGDTLGSFEREASEDVADSVQRLVDEATCHARWIAAVEKQQDETRTRAPMVHHSNPKCDVCGERHSAGHIGECNEALVQQIADLKEQVEALETADAK